MDDLKVFKTSCEGGLITHNDVLYQGEQEPGSTINLLNYEPAVTGGYRRITGFTNSFPSLPGTGAVLGVTIAENVQQGVLAARNPSSGNNYLHYFNFYYTISGITSGSSFTVGETVTGGTSGVIAKVVSKASTTIVVNFNISGQINVTQTTFTNGETISGVSSSHSSAVSTSVQIGWETVTTNGSPTMVGVDKVRFTRYNINGTDKVILTDGINKAATYGLNPSSGNYEYTRITHANALTAPKYSAEYQGRIILAGDPARPTVFQYSSSGDETDFDSTLGAGEFSVGFDIVAIKVFRNTMFIFGTHHIKSFTGNSEADFNLQPVTEDLGCLAQDSIVEIGGNLVFLGPDGLRPVAATDRLGDIELETISKNIQSIFNRLIETEDLSKLSVVLLRKKSQLRIFFGNADNSGVILGLRKRGNQAISYEYGELLGFDVTCASSGYVGETELVIHGTSDGKVMEQEQGNSFNGTNILSVFQTPYYYFGDPELRKNFIRVSTYFRSEGLSTIAMKVTYDFDDSNIINPTENILSTEGAAAFFNQDATFDTTDIYDGNPSPVKRTNITGSGLSISMRYVTNDTNASHSVQGLTIMYGLGDRR